MKNVTVWDVALARGLKENDDGGVTMGQFDAVGLPMLGGCHRCGACIAAYNACPTTTGYLACVGCVGDGEGFPTAKAFEAWTAWQDALREAAEAEEDEPRADYDDDYATVTS
jgi:hypothetical protein